MSSSTKLQAGAQLLTKSSWDPGWLTSARRATVRDQLPRGDTQHTWDDAPTAYPRNQVAGTGEVIRRTPHLGRVCSPSTWLPELIAPGKGKTQAQPSLCLCGVPKNLNLSGLDLGSAHNPGPALDSPPAEQPEAWAVQTGKAHTSWVGAKPVWSRHTVSTPHTHQWYLFAVFLPPHNTTEQVSLNKSFVPLCQGRN